MTRKRNNSLKQAVVKEFNFMKNIFSIMNIPLQMKGDFSDVLTSNNNLQNDGDIKKTERARSITELEEKLEKIKSNGKITLKNKYLKKSLSSKLNKRLKKKQRTIEKKSINIAKQVKMEKIENKPAKPIFNNEGKLVFSKFDFAQLGGTGKQLKSQKDPKRLLENLKKEEEMVQKLKETASEQKVIEVKDKIAWKNVLKKAEGEKIKDDPNLLKKSIKKIEQKKKQSKSRWEMRQKNVTQKKEERQKKRQENIAKKKKDKQVKVKKTAAKKGRVII